MTPKEAATLISDLSADFVYIDDRHDYCSVREALELYWPKLKVGGVMAGHDFLTAEDARKAIPDSVVVQDWSVCGDGRRYDDAVRGAVMDFVSSKSEDLEASNIIAMTTQPEGHIWKSWGFWKTGVRQEKEVCIRIQ